MPSSALPNSRSCSRKPKPKLPPSKATLPCWKARSRFGEPESLCLGNVGLLLLALIPRPRRKATVYLQERQTVCKASHDRTHRQGQTPAWKLRGQVPQVQWTKMKKKNSCAERTSCKISCQKRRVRSSRQRKA